MWFAWKFVPLWYQQQRTDTRLLLSRCCDLLENSYLCGISNNISLTLRMTMIVVICLKIRTFVVSATTATIWWLIKACCDLLENSYLCGISNNRANESSALKAVVICLKIRTFVVSATTRMVNRLACDMLWFAWKFVPLWYQQQL